MWPVESDLNLSLKIFVEDSVKPIYWHIRNNKCSYSRLAFRSEYVESSSSLELHVKRSDKAISFSAFVTLVKSNWLCAWFGKMVKIQNCTYIPTYIFLYF